jgi:hypothetical protein
MTLSYWTAHLCDELARQMAKRIERRPAEDGCFRVGLGQYGLLAMEEDGTDALLWLLDAEGRTNGPLWIGVMSQETAAAAAARVAKVVRGAPDAATFTAWPPTRRDTAREDAVNTLWATVKERIDQVPLPSRGETDIKEAIATVELYIDELARSDEGATIAEFADPFKAEAANAIRRRAIEVR